MNIFVFIKQVPGIRSDIIPNDEANYIDTTKLRWIICPEDDCAVGNDFAPKEYLIGQSGTRISPLLYIACGISGAVHHIAGIRLYQLFFDCI